MDSNDSAIGNFDWHSHGYKKFWINFWIKEKINSKFHIRNWFWWRHIWGWLTFCSYAALRLPFLHVLFGFFSHFEHFLLWFVFWSFDRVGLVPVISALCGGRSGKFDALWLAGSSSSAALMSSSPLLYSLPGQCNLAIPSRMINCLNFDIESKNRFSARYLFNQLHRLY